MSTDLIATLRELNLGEYAPSLEDHWDADIASMPAELPFLDSSAIPNLREFAGLQPALDEELLKAADRVRSSPELTRLAWHIHQLVYTHREFPSQRMGDWPVLTAQLGELAGMFYLLIGLSAIPQMVEFHRARGVPEEVTRATTTHYGESVRVHEINYGGLPGFMPRVLYWLRNHTAGELYCLGRMEYMVRPFPSHVQVYRNGETGDVLALARAGYRYDEDGYYAVAGTEDPWEATLEESEGEVTGHPIRPTGTAQRERVTLDLGLWEPALMPGDGVLDTHIPPGGGMTLEKCRDTMQQALDFFPKYFPERTFKGFSCGSWILNPQLAEIYRPDSNMVLWQRQLYLYPIPSDCRSGLYFVFGKTDVDPATAPRDTSLRRALLEHLEKGGCLRAGGMFLLTEDFAKFGEG